MEELMQMTIPINSHVEQIIADSFLLFDSDGSRSVKRKHVAKILRILGCSPCETDINEILKDCFLKEFKYEIHLSTFLPKVLKMLAAKRMQPATANELLEAFQLFDPNDDGYIKANDFINLMKTKGEPMTDTEFAEMLKVAIDVRKQNVPYEFYIRRLVHKTQFDIFKEAAQIEEARIQTSKKPRRTLLQSFYESNM